VDEIRKPLIENRTAESPPSFEPQKYSSTLPSTYGRNKVELRPPQPWRLVHHLLPDPSNIEPDAKRLILQVNQRPPIRNRIVAFGLGLSYEVRDSGIKGCWFFDGGTGEDWVAFSGQGYGREKLDALVVLGGLSVSLGRRVSL
jgi:hypothetical protein